MTPSQLPARSGRWVHRLVRPLADDDVRARFWVQHVRVGVVFSEIAAALVGAYAVVADRPARTLLLAVAAAVVLSSPVLLALPVSTWVRGLRGTLFFYAWSASLIAVITVLAHVDGGAASPLALLLFLTLTFAVLTYPPLGVAAVGALAVSVHVGLVATSSAPWPGTTSTTAVLALYTAMTCWTARNQWDTQDQQHLLAARLASLASTDPLTQCLNRGALHDRLDGLAAAASPTAPVAALLIDLDGFKQVNDSLGHAAGDAVLVDVARVLRTTTRETDCVARLGGDEFVVVLHGTSAHQAPVVAEQLRARIGEQCAASGVTASIGLTTTTAPLPGSELLSRADRAMYVAKHGGRDRICAATSSSAPSPTRALPSSPSAPMGPRTPDGGVPCPCCPGCASVRA